MSRLPDAIMLDGLRTARNELGKLASPKGLMEYAVEDAWEECESWVGDPKDGIVMHDLGVLADAIIDHLQLRLLNLKP